MNKLNLILNISTTKDMSDWQMGRPFIEKLSSDGDLMRPQFYSHVDPINLPFTSIEDCETSWAAPYSYTVDGTLYEAVENFMWRRNRKVRHTGFVKHSLTNIYGEVVPALLRIDSRWSADIDWLDLFRWTSNHFQAHIGLLHVYTKAEAAQIADFDDFQIGGFGWALKPKVEQFGWAMVMGDRFAEFVNPDAISDAGFPIYRTRNGFVFSVTDNIADVVNDFAKFDDRRNALRALFPESFFNTPLAI